MIALSRLSRRRLVALYLVLSLAPLVSLAYLAITITTNAVTHRVDQSLSLSASISALYVGEQMQSLEEIVDSFAHLPGLVTAMGDGDPARYDLPTIDATLNQLSNVRRGIAGALLVRPDGTLIDVFPYRISAAFGANFSSNDWYQAVIRSKIPYVSSGYASTASGSPRVAAVSAPVSVVGGDGTPGPLLGVIAIEYSSNTIQDFSRRFAAAQGVIVEVADQRGAYVAASQTSPGPDDRDAIGDALLGKSGLIQTKAPGALLVAYAPVPRIGWAVTAQLPASDAFAEVNRLRTTVLAIAVPLALVLVLGAWLLDTTLGFWQRAEAEIKRLAAIDSLSGLWNRRSWDDQLARELARAQRDRRPLCVGMIDLDHFKQFNDVHGHPAGDRLLAGTAAAWRSAIRATDVLARYGGEEFAIALPDCTTGDAVAIMDRLRAVMPEGQTCSAGVACWDGAEPGSILMSRADRALYEAKRGGRDRVVVAAAPAAAA